MPNYRVIEVAGIYQAQRRSRPFLSSTWDNLGSGCTTLDQAKYKIEVFKGLDNPKVVYEE